MKYILFMPLMWASLCWGQSDLALKVPHSNRDSRLSESVSSLAFRSPLPEFQGVSNSGNYEKKNVSTAVLYSLLLPGMGELYVGDYGTGKYFTIIEGALWLTMGAYDWYATGLRDDARRFAMQHAHISLAGKDDQYFVDIGEFRNVYDYNEQILRNRSPELLYNPATAYWNWDNDANRFQFTDLRIASDERFNDMRFVAAAIALNHIVSAINAARMAVLHNRSVSPGSGTFDVHASVLGGLGHPDGILISVSRTF